MANGQRPGGLTALAVLNFVFGGLGAITWILALLGAAAITKMGGAVGALYATVGIGLLSAILLIISAVGYLGQKKMGRTLGTAYGVLALINVIISIAVVGAGFGFGTIIGLIYPLLTLYFVNVTYKNNLVN